jgi:hypothetical protein
MKSSIFCDITPYSPLKINKRASPVRYVLHAGSWLGSFFDPEDEDDMFLRNAGWFSADYMALYPRSQNFSYASQFFLSK